jgi:hypothetical protein
MHSGIITEETVRHKTNGRKKKSSASTNKKLLRSIKKDKSNKNIRKIK